MLGTKLRPSTALEAGDGRETEILRSFCCKNSGEATHVWSPKHHFSVLVAPNFPKPSQSLLAVPKINQIQPGESPERFGLERSVHTSNLRLQSRRFSSSEAEMPPTAISDLTLGMPIKARSRTDCSDANLRALAMVGTWHGLIFDAAHRFSNSHIEILPICWRMWTNSICPFVPCFVAQPDHFTPLLPPWFIQFVLVDDLGIPFGWRFGAWFPALQARVAKQDMLGRLDLLEMGVHRSTIWRVFWGHGKSPTKNED